MRFGADHVFGARIPNNNVCVAARRERSFFWIHTENARGRGRNDFYETIQRKFTFVHTVMMKKLQAIFDSRAAVRDFCEVIFAETFLVLETERAVVGGNHL